MRGTSRSARNRGGVGGGPGTVREFPGREEVGTGSGGKGRSGQGTVTMAEDRERKRLEKAEKKERAREEKARLKAERKAEKERRKREKLQAMEELRELPEVAEGEGEAAACAPPGGGPAGETEDAALAAEDAVSLGLETPAPTSAESGGEEPSAQPPCPGTGEAAEAPRRGEGEEAGEEREGWLPRLRRGLSKSRMNFMAPLSRALATRRFDDAFWEEVEEILVGADVGMEMTMTMVDRVKERMAREKVRDPDAFLDLFREVLAESLDAGEAGLRFARSGPSVIMVVGVNGTGKTTTIAKLAHLLRGEGKRVILAAGDTFRAAGIEQLEVWGERVGVHTVKHRQGADAAAVIHDAVESARARGVDVVIADTAGRLHTKVNLMEELRKIKRVAERNAEVTETLLVIDATTGQNGLIQARQFGEAVEVTGVVLTKLDGTAKGGIVVAIVHELGIPIKFIGVGEGLEDLHAFDPREFASALLSPAP